MELQPKNQSTLLNKIKYFFHAWKGTLKLKSSVCDLCLGKKLSHPLLCQYCQHDLPYIDLQKIGNNLLHWPAIDKLFPKREFEQLFCLAPYIWPFDQWIKQLKYQSRFELADLLAYLLSRSWCMHTTDNTLPVVLSVPIHITKWQHRGFNQAHLIAKNFAKNCGYSYLADALIRTKSNQSQVGQSGKERRKNLREAFTINTKYTDLPKHVLLLDDVITTGSTVNEISHLLKQKGVKSITVLTVAITLPKTKSI